MQRPLLLGVLLFFLIAALVCGAPNAVEKVVDDLREGGVIVDGIETEQDLLLKTYGPDLIHKCTQKWSLFDAQFTLALPFIEFAARGRLLPVETHDEPHSIMFNKMQTEQKLAKQKGVDVTPSWVLSFAARQVATKKHPRDDEFYNVCGGYILDKVRGLTFAAPDASPEESARQNFSVMIRDITDFLLTDKGKTGEEQAQKKKAGGEKKGKGKSKDEL